MMVMGPSPQEKPDILMMPALFISEPSFCSIPLFPEQSILDDEAGNGHDDRSQERHPKALNFKRTAHKAVCHHEGESINDKQEKSEGKNRHWQCQNNQDRPDQDIQDRQDEACPQRRPEA